MVGVVVGSGADWVARACAGVGREYEEGPEGGDRFQGLTKWDILVMKQRLRAVGKRPLESQRVWVIM